MKSLALLAALAMAGCYDVTFTNGRPPARLPYARDAVHVEVPFDVATIDAPFRLDLDCPDTGWAAIEVREPPLESIASDVGTILVHAGTASIWCATAKPVASPSTSAVARGR